MACKRNKFTPGPWLIDRDGVGARWNIDGENGDSVGMSHQLPNDKDWKIRDANTRLMASSPRLLEMLEDALEWIDAVPQDTVLPTMPGFCREDVDDLIAHIKG